MKDNDNVYFVARKSAALYNDKLWSRDGAAELLGVSISTLADYELGNTKVVPVDKVVLMADLYNCPELKNGYCKYECPIGKTMPIAAHVKSVEGNVLRMVKQLDSGRIEKIKRKLVDIAADGSIADEEKPELEEIISYLNDLAEVISETRLIGEKVLRINT